MDVMKYVRLFMILLFCTRVSAGGLFEDAGSSDDSSEETQEKTYELTGFLRGVYYGGLNSGDEEAETKSGYAEAAMKLGIRHGRFGDAFSDIRFRKGVEFTEELEDWDFREAYVKTYIGRFDVIFGQQVVTWGRADGFNPTDNISPKNMLVRSPNEDDRRGSNFLFRTFFNLQPVRLEAIWVPYYQASVLPIDVIPLPTNVSIGEPQYPEETVENSGFALKANLELAKFDGSLSYFNGYNPFPGIDLGTQTPSNFTMMPHAYRMHVSGADFSTMLLGKVGLRGEFAYRRPYDDWKESVYIPNPDLQYTVGFDREIITNFSVIL